jgi:hypothetical protein
VLADTGALLLGGSFGAADLNKGVKYMWEKDKIDATRVKYKAPGSTITQSMDEAKGLKKTDPAAYESLKKMPLFMSAFFAEADLEEIGSFSASPTEGFIGFTRYAKEGGTGNELIRQILDHN